LIGLRHYGEVRKATRDSTAATYHFSLFSPSRFKSRLLVSDMPRPNQISNRNPFNSLETTASQPLTGTLREAKASLVRIGFGRDAERFEVSIPRQDAFYVVFQLRDYQAHDYWIDGRAKPAPASPRGGLHIADINALHSALLVGRFDSFNMIIPRAFLDELADDIAAPRISSLAVPDPWQTIDRRIASLAPALIDVLAEPAGCGSLFADQLTTTIALHIAEQYGGLRRSTIRLGALAPWQERRARDMIAANLTKEISLAEIAAQCELSVSHFARAFKASVGATPHGWLQARRIEKSKELLTRSRTSLTAIAMQCGFADQSHFNRIFKRATGLTPGAWRRAC
jgi:AraC family transcriptional regulator